MYDVEPKPKRPVSLAGDILDIDPHHQPGWGTYGASGWGHGGTGGWGPPPDEYHTDTDEPSTGGGWVDTDSE